MDKHTKIRVESWCKKFCQIINNTEWKKNRNLHAICLLDMIINERYEEPYNKFAPDGPLPIMPKHIVKSRLTKKFWYFTKTLHNKPQVYDDGSSYNINSLSMNIDNKNIRLKTPDNKYRYKYGNKNTHFYEMINKCNNPDLLNKIIERLENKISKADEVIIQQEEERNQLLQKIEKLEKLIQPYLKNNK